MEKKYDPFNAEGILDQKVVSALSVKSSVYEYLVSAGVSEINAEAITNNTYTFARDYGEKILKAAGNKLTTSDQDAILKEIDLYMQNEFKRLVTKGRDLAPIAFSTIDIATTLLLVGLKQSIWYIKEDK